MRKGCGIIFLSFIVWIAHLSGFSYGEPPEAAHVNQGISLREQAELASIEKDRTEGSEEDGNYSLVPFVCMDLEGFGIEPSGRPGSSNLDETRAYSIRLSMAEESKDNVFEDEEDFPIENSFESINDPLEPINRAFFYFNDKFYFWFLKPAASTYRIIVPQTARIGVRNFFYNLSFPIRFVNCLLQLKFDSAGYEFSRFFINSTVGLAGFLDIATNKLEMQKYEEDFGQTLGSYGMGPALYINWPILGPSSLRGTAGLIGDAFLDPVNYVVPRTKYNVSIKSYNSINKTSLTIGDYEDLKRSALDPYIAVRDAYYQYRNNKIKE